MISNYFKLAWRSLLKHRFVSGVNIGGLSIGITFILLVVAYIWNEYQVNTTLKDNERTYILLSEWKDGTSGMPITTFAPLGKALKQNYPTLVEDYYHHDGLMSIVSKGDKHFEEALQPGDSTMLSMFGFELLHGDDHTALNKPNAIVITANKAIKYFGKTDAVGEVLTIKSFGSLKQDFEVTAVLKDLPYNTVTNYNNSANEVFLPASALKFFGRDQTFEDWNNPYVVNYIKLKPGVSPAALEGPIKQLLKLNTKPDIQKSLNISLSPLKDFYLQQNNGVAMKMIYTLASVGGFILLMAIINFINISVGSSVSRLKEIGVRKVLGSSRKQLVVQYLTESVLLVAFATLITLVAYLAVKPMFSDILGKQLPAITDFPVWFAGLPFLLILLTGVLAGLYPAIILSAQSSVQSLKGKLKTVKEKMAFRYTLITVQFVTAIIVFVAAIVIQRQVSFFFNSNLGYDKEQLITAAIPRDWTPEGVKHMETVRNEFAALPVVASASFSYEIPNGASGNNGRMIYKGSQNAPGGINAATLIADEKYADTYLLHLLAGQFLDEADPLKIVINQSTAKAFGWHNAAQAIGQQIAMQDAPQMYTVAGVIGDFHFGGMQGAIGPLLFMHVKHAPFYRYMSLKVKPGNMQQTMAVLQQKWSSLFPEAPFNYVFMDDTLAKMYQAEIRMKKASAAATVVALVIVLLGVLSMVTLSITRRIKEVGIRKVLGASNLHVIGIFVKEFSWMVLIANLIAWPIAYFMMYKWLQNYAYKIHLNAAPFVIVGGAICTLVAFVIFVRSFKVAVSNPVKSLRSE